jgi:hypothetical protein
MKRLTRLKDFPEFLTEVTINITTKMLKVARNQLLLSISPHFLKVNLVEGSIRGFKATIVTVNSPALSALQRAEEMGSAKSIEKTSPDIVIIWPPPLSFLSVHRPFSPGAAIAGILPPPPLAGL